jgi:hypothetical protein
MGMPTTWWECDICHGLLVADKKPDCRFCDAGKKYMSEVGARESNPRLVDCGDGVYNPQSSDGRGY